MTELLIYLLYGSVIGIIGGYAGIGGAPFLIILLTLVSHFSQHSAQGTVLAVMLGPMSLLGVKSLWPLVKKNIKIIIIGFCTYALFSYFGGALAYRISAVQLKTIFSIFLIILGIFFIIQEIFTQVVFKFNIKLNTFLMIIIGASIGIIGGFLGIGAGIILVPILIYIFHFNKDEARAISLAILLPPVSIGAVLKYNQNQDVNWLVCIVLFCGYFLTNYIGAALGTKHEKKLFLICLGSILIFNGIINIFQIFIT